MSRLNHKELLKEAATKLESARYLHDHGFQLESVEALNQSLDITLQIDIDQPKSDFRDPDLDNLIDCQKMIKAQFQSLQKSWSQDGRKKGFDPNFSFLLRELERKLLSIHKNLHIGLLSTEEKERRHYFIKTGWWTASILCFVGILIVALKLILPMGHGLTGEYYTKKNLSKMYDTRLDKNIDFQWEGRPWFGMSNDSFSIRWTGEIYAPRSGLYEFLLECDDGSRMWINQHQLVDDWKIHGISKNRASMHLAKGWHKIRIELFDETQRSLIRLYWKRPRSENLEIIGYRYFRPSKDSIRLTTH